MASGEGQAKPMDLSFGQVEAVLSAVHGIADHKRTAFVGRLKNLQKNGLRLRAAAGRGKSATYGMMDLCILGAGLELSKAGITPARSGATLRLNFDDLTRAMAREVWDIVGGLRNGIANDVSGWTDSNTPSDLYMSINIDGLSGLIDDEDDDTKAPSFLIDNAPIKPISGLFKDGGGRWSALTINFSRLLRRIFAAICYDLKFYEFRVVAEDISMTHAALRRQAYAGPEHNLGELNEARSGIAWGDSRIASTAYKAMIPTILWTGHETYQYASEVEAIGGEGLQRALGLIANRTSEFVRDNPEGWRDRLRDFGVLEYSGSHCILTNIGAHLMIIAPNNVWKIHCYNAFRKAA